MSEPLGVAVIAAGAGLLYAALTNQNPITELRAALSTAQRDGRRESSGRPFGAGILSSIGGIVSNLAPSTSTPSTSTTGPSSTPPAAAGDWPDDPPNLVTFGQGGHRLAAPAAAAFRAWQANYGRNIPITDSYRSTAAQREAHERDPNRFAAPGDSAHGEGRAVDVNLGALGITVTGEPASWLGNPAYAALVASARATGWCNYQVQNRSANGRTSEPWHFSWGVCK